MIHVETFHHKSFTNYLTDIINQKHIQKNDNNIHKSNHWIKFLFKSEINNTISRI